MEELAAALLSYTDGRPGPGPLSTGRLSEVLPG